MGPRLRESRLPSPSGREGEFTQPWTHLLADPCTVLPQAQTDLNIVCEHEGHENSGNTVNYLFPVHIKVTSCGVSHIMQTDRASLPTDSE